MTKIVLFTQNTMASIVASREVINKHPDKIKAIVLVNQIKGDTFYDQLKVASKFVAKSSKEFFIYKLIESKLYNLLIKIYKIFSKNSKTRTSIEELAKSHNIPLIYTKDVNNVDFLKIIKSYEPDYVLCLVAQILKSEVFETLGNILINAHGSYLPKYRGAAQYFWYLINEDPCFGVTIHHMTTGLDTGDIIFQKEFPYDQNISAYKLHHELSIKFGEMFNEFIEKYSDTKYKTLKQDNKNATYTTFPTKKDIQIFKRKNKTIIRAKDFLRCV